MSGHRPATVVVWGDGNRQTSRRFVAELEPQTSPGDQVVLLGSGRDPDDSAAWRVVGPGRSLRRLAGDRPPPAPHPVIVVVDDRATLSEGWLDRLVAAFEVPEIGVAAPTSNVADGDELLVGVPYRPGERSARARFLRQVGAAERARAVRAGRLGGPCVAVRRAVLGPDGPARWRAHPDVGAWVGRAGRLGLGAVVVPGAHAHHPGGVPRYPSEPRRDLAPLVSACLIVKDEEANLGRCLGSVTEVADEVVVYDTGSTDGSVPLARRLGATVVEGHWDGDFARARNAALDACSGRWVLWLDADEALVCDDPRGLRGELAAASSDAEGFLVMIDNIRGNEAATVMTHPACRLFRRACGRWEGGVHEQVVARSGSVDLTLQLTDALRITHWGYLQAAMTGRAKADRNLRSAFGDLAGGSELDRGARLLSLGRSHLLAGHHVEGLDLCRQAAAIASYPGTVRLALRGLAEGLLALEKPDEALVEIDRLRRISAVPSLANVLEGRARLDLDQPAAALACFDAVRDGLDDDGFEYGPRDVAAGRAEALAALGRHGEAADTLLDSLRRDGGLDTHVGLLVENLVAAGRGLGEIAQAVPAHRAKAFVPQLLQLQPEAADPALEAWYVHDPSSEPVLATAAVLAPRLEVSRQLVWSHRLRRHGVPAACPLVRSATDLTIAAATRAIAAAAAAAFGDPRARPAFTASVLAVPPGEWAATTQAVAALDGGLAALMQDLGAPAEPATSAGPRPGPGSGSGFTEPPHGPARPVLARPGPSMRRVLVVDADLSALRSAAVAVVLARAGHSVTVVQPQPAAPLAALLEPAGVTVHGWSASEEPWTKAAARVLARLYAEATYDTVVLSASAAELVPTIRRLLPAAAVVLDLDDAGPGSAPAADVGGGAGDHARPDLLFSSLPPAPPDAAPGGDRGAGTGSGPRAPVALLRASAATALGPRPPTPLGARHGICIVGNFRSADPASRSRWTDEVAPVLADRLGAVPVVVVGDDPGGDVAAPFPAALDAGPLADPTPWLRSARVVVVPFLDRAEHWLGAAALCGTPALVVPDGTGTAAFVEAVAALAANDELWRRFAPLAPAATEEAPNAPDPLATLTGPSRAPARPLGSTEAPAPVPPAPGLRWVGDVFAHHSLARVNRELVARLGTRLPRLRVTTAEGGARPGDSAAKLAAITLESAADARTPVALEVRHQWPPDFAPARSGRLVLMQPWEFGGFPAEWVGPVRDVVDELWVPTAWVRTQAVASGIPEAKVVVVPNGVDTATFTPRGPRLPLQTTKGTRLLFVGGCIARKGIDALVETYLATFDEDDDVCLVVKPFGSDGVYRDTSIEGEIRRAAAGGGAAIEVVDGDLSDEQMTALYRSCDALVHPYRGEGFALPVAEAMACGLPVVVTGGGATDDFCDGETGWILPSRRTDIRPGDWTPTAAGTWWLEPDRRSLAGAMRSVMAEPASWRRRGQAARDRIVARFTWEAAVEVVAGRIAVLAGLGHEPSSGPPVPLAAGVGG
ncbi:MAG TPA: glycosyltransferase [Acidimicrobiales bacterium]